MKMKKIRLAALLVSVVVVSLGFISCGEMATLQIENDTGAAQTFWLRFDGEYEDSARTMAPGGRATFNRSNGFTVEFRRIRTGLLDGTLWNYYRTSVTPGETVTVMLSDVF